MMVDEITEGQWNYRRNAQLMWTITNLSTGQPLPRLAATIPDARRYTFEATTQTRFTIAAGPGRAQHTRRHIN